MHLQPTQLRTTISSLISAPCTNERRWSIGPSTCRQKYNVTLVFVGFRIPLSLCSVDPHSRASPLSVVASSATDVQPKPQPDSSELSEAYLRASLLGLNRSIVPDEDPAAPQVWDDPPTKIVTTPDLLYMSPLMSLLAAFVAMLGKQWLNRYLRHTRGSVVERCGDRQRELGSLEKLPFHLFILSRQIALLLTCGLSRYT
jgi:hypothetical protein